MQSKRQELHKLMKEAKTYSLPESCPCGHKAKKNWIEMESHYDKCGQYRILVKKLTHPKNNKNFKRVLKIQESLGEIVPMLRQMELHKKFSGHDKLIEYESVLPKEVYLFVEACLDDHDKDYKTVIDYKIIDEK